MSELEILKEFHSTVKAQNVSVGAYYLTFSNAVKDALDNCEENLNRLTKRAADFCGAPDVELIFLDFCKCGHTRIEHEIRNVTAVSTTFGKCKVSKCNCKKMRPRNSS